MTDRCLYFGCWNTPGHYLVAPNGYRARGFSPEQEYRLLRKLDAAYAPRKGRDGTLCWAAMADTPEDDCSLRWRIRDSSECRQGKFLRHKLEGFTLIQWWDRCQGDRRGACNSTILLEGEHTTEEMLAALEEHFPHVLANLKRHGVELVEVKT